MAGPTCEVLLASNDDSTPDVIDTVLANAAERIDRTRKGRAWDVWVSGHPIHVWVDGPRPVLGLAAGCNGPEDYAVLRQLAADLGSALDGLASEPIK
jgi:hypothetical protein